MGWVESRKINGKMMYSLTTEGFGEITKMLEDGGFFPEIDMAGFEANGTWAAIMGTAMVEAGGNYLKSVKDEVRSEDLEATMVAVGLYIAQAQAEVDKQKL